MPRPNCWIRVISISQPKLTSGFIITPTSIRVMKIAMGSLRPDSISRVLATRSLMVTPAPLTTLKTAAASVEPMMPPSSRPRRQSTSINQVAKAPTSEADSITPTVARLSAGFNARRKVVSRVRRPPSSRIIARAILLTT